MCFFLAESPNFAHPKVLLFPLLDEQNSKMFFFLYFFSLDWWGRSVSFLVHGLLSSCSTSVPIFTTFYGTVLWAAIDSHYGRKK